LKKKTQLQTLDTTNKTKQKNPTKHETQNTKALKKNKQKKNTHKNKTTHNNIICLFFISFFSFLSIPEA